MCVLMFPLLGILLSLLFPLDERFSSNRYEKLAYSSGLSCQFLLNLYHHVEMCVVRAFEQLFFELYNGVRRLFVQQELVMRG
jgi:hypothetical protein